jgi:hypothetical protein
MHVFALEVPAAYARIHEATRQASHGAIAGRKQLGNGGRRIEVDQERHHEPGVESGIQTQNQGKQTTSNAYLHIHIYILTFKRKLKLTRKKQKLKERTSTSR